MSKQHLRQPACRTCSAGLCYDRYFATHALPLGI